jgi:hypothetical protein
MTPFQKMISQARETKLLDKALPGAESKYLGDGPHDVTITAVDSSGVDRGAIDFVFEDAEGRSHKEKVFLADYKDKEAFSVSIRRIWAALFLNRDVTDRFLDEWNANKEAHNMFTGMKLNITLKPGPGYVVKVTDDRKFGGYDSENGNLLTQLYDSVEDVKNEAGAKNIKRAFRRIFQAKATNADRNIAQLDAAIKARAQAKAGIGGVAGGVSGGTSGAGGII